jgi:hypothetical protein
MTAFAALLAGLWIRPGGTVTGGDDQNLTGRCRAA